MSDITRVVLSGLAPVLVIHGGAGNYLASTTSSERAARGAALEDIARQAFAALTRDGARAGVLAALAGLEANERFNAGRGAKLQQDGRARLSASLMDGARLRLSSVSNVCDCLHPSQLADALQARADRNLDALGARALMRDLGVVPTDVRTQASLARWRRLVARDDRADAEGAIGDAGTAGLETDAEASARSPAPAQLPADIAALRRTPPESRSGTVGAVALDLSGALWAGTSTGGRGHEAPGRISDTPTPAGNYACPKVALSATGFGEQILDLALCGRIATRVLDGAALSAALARTFEEVAAHGGPLGVIAVGADGTWGYAHTSEAMGVAAIDASGTLVLDTHSQPQHS